MTYGFLLLLPTATLLLFLDDPATLTFRRRLFWALQLGLMFDVVTLWRWFGAALHLPADAGLFLIHVDRVLMLALFSAVGLLSALEMPFRLCVFASLRRNSKITRLDESSPASFCRRR